MKTIVNEHVTYSVSIEFDYAEAKELANVLLLKYKNTLDINVPFVISNLINALELIK